MRGDSLQGGMSRVMKYVESGGDFLLRRWIHGRKAGGLWPCGTSKATGWQGVVLGGGVRFVYARGFRRVMRDMVSGGACLVHRWVCRRASVER